MRRLAALLLMVTVINLVFSPAAYAGSCARISGSDRYLTAIEVSKAGWEFADTVVLARGDHWADALAGAPLASQLDAPILLTYIGGLHPAVPAELERLGTRQVIILGGPAAVSAAVGEDLKSRGLQVERIGGADRYATAAEIAKMVAPAGSARVILASGEDFPDALAAASYAAAISSPIILSKKDSLPQVAKNALEAMGSPQVLIIGGEAAISAGVAGELTNAIRLGGKNRYETCVAVIRYFQPRGGHYYIVTGLDFSDALTGSVLAARRGEGLLLVGKKLSPVVAGYVGERVGEFTVLGGASVINQEVVDSILQNLALGAGSISGWTEPGATVQAGSLKVIAGEDGFYELFGLAAGIHQVEFRKTGFATETAAVKVSGGRTSAINRRPAELAQGDILVTGVVIDRSGLPLADARVVLEIWDPVWKMWERIAEASTGFDGRLYWTNAKGMFDFSSLLRVSVYKKGFQPLQREWELAGDAVRNDIPGLHLRKLLTSSVSGKITCNGQAVAGAGINLLAADGSIVAQAVSAGNGDYHMSALALADGAYIFTAEKEGFGRFVRCLQLREGTDVQLDPELIWGRKLAIHLAPVELFFGGEPAYFARGNYSLRLLKGATEVMRKDLTDRGGQILSFEMPRSVEPGLYTVLVSGDYAGERSFEITVGDEDTTFCGRANLAGGISGIVSDKEGAPLEGAVVSVVSPAGEKKEIKTGQGGEYFLTGLLPGQYQVEIAKPRFQSLISVVTVTANTSTRLEVSLGKISFVGTVQGYVRTAGSLAAAEGAEVSLSLTKPGLWPGKAVEGYIANTVVDAAGYFQMAGLPPGRYSIVIKHPGRHETFTGSISVQQGETLDMGKILLETGGKARLTIIIKDVEKSAKVRVTDPWGLEEKGSVSEDRAVFSGLSAGRHVIRVEQEGYWPVHQEVCLDNNGEAVIEINPIKKQLQQAFFRIFGAQNLPLSAVIQIFAEDGSIVELICDQTGLAIAELVEGNYFARVIADGYYVDKAYFTISENDVFVPVLQLESWE